MTYWRIFRLFFYLGWISFGGPAAHLGLFQREIIEKRQWLTLEQYVQLVALCQIIPGPSSSQVGMALGYYRGGFAGSCAAWLGFTFPSALMMFSVAMLHGNTIGGDWQGIGHGLKLVACAIVTVAVIQMTQAMGKDWQSYAIIALIVGLILVTPLVQWPVVLIVIAALAGMLLFRYKHFASISLQVDYSKSCAVVCLSVFLIGLVGSLLYTETDSIGFLAVLYQASSLVFGGGHVVLALLQQELLHYPLSPEQFLIGYGMIQAMPGPLFNIAAYLGAATYPTSPYMMAFAAVIAIFLPAALVLFGVLRFANTLQHYPKARQALHGINVGVIGLLIGALISMFNLTVTHFQDIAVLIIAIGLLLWRRLPVTMIVLLCMIYGHFIW